MKIDRITNGRRGGPALPFPWHLAAWILLLASSCRFGLAAEAPADSAFLTRDYTNAAGQKLPYRLLMPHRYEPERAYPVILYLHGAAARGTDNKEPLNWGPRLFQANWLQEKHDFFLVVPQAPKNSGWAELDWSSGGAKESASLAMAVELVAKSLPREFRIDPRKRYLTGVSMGGHAVWVLLARRPGFFAAAVPVCSGGSPRTVTDAAAKCPIWAFHSDDDHLVPVQQARAMVQAWKAHGGTAKYTEYTGVKHSSWKKAYADPAMFDWLFTQRLP